MTVADILTIRNLGMRFGGLQALAGVDLRVVRGSITALIGPNGAGKTTVFNCLTGFYRPNGGEMCLATTYGSTDLVEVLGQPINVGDLVSPARLVRKIGYKAFGGTHMVNRAGLARTFQNIRLFREMTVIENLLVAQHMRINRNLLAGVLNTRGYRRAEAVALKRAFDWLDFLGLGDSANRLAGELPYGQQRHLEIARALCTGPELLCLDEPAAGLNPAETAKLSRIIHALRQDHAVTVLLIEHDMGLVMGISDHVYVLDSGRVIASGSPATVQNDPRVIAVYLGAGEEEGSA